MKFAAAILISIALHAGILLSFVSVADWFGGDVELAQLDLSAVELSFSEKEENNETISPVIPQIPQEATDAQEKALPKENKEPDVKFEEEPLEPPLDANEAQLEELKSEDVEADDFRAKPEPPRKVVREEKKQEAVQEAPAIKAANQARVDAQPRLKRSIEPRYPDAARKRGEQGTVVFEIVIDRKGRVESCAIIKSSGFSELDRAAEKAVRAAQFVPAKINGKSVSSTRRLPVDFKLK